MAYTFEHIKREVYPKTFLKDVHVSLYFQAVDITDSLPEKVGRFFEESFNVKDVKAEDLTKPVSVYSKDEMIRFYFSLSHVELAVKQPAYRSYEHIEALRKKAFEYLDLMGVESLSKVMLYKYNQLGYQLTESGSVADVMRDIFSPSLLGNMTEEDMNSLDGLSRWERSYSLKGEDETNSSFTIEYGFRKKSLDSETDALTLKTQIETGIVVVNRDDLPRVLSEFNQILDNGFHWCVTTGIVDEMKK